MSDWRTLTAHFGERKRVGRELLADALLDLYERRAIATSLLVRGVEGFGLRHHLRTDSLLSLSEDLPAVAIATDEADRIDALAGEVVELVGQGLVTVSDGRHHVDDRGDARLTIYLRRLDRVAGRAAHAAACDALWAHGVDGATTLLGVDGTWRGGRQRARFFARNADVPMQIIAVGSSDSIELALPDVRTMLPDSLCTLSALQVCKRDGVLLGEPRATPSGWRRLTVYTSEAHLHHGRPIHREITRRLRGSGSRGVTTVRGIRGFHVPHAPHGERFGGLGRHVPVLTSVVDTADGIGIAFPIVDALTDEHGLVTCETVDVLS